MKKIISICVMVFAMCFFAKDYADSVGAAALVQAKAYTDTKVANGMSSTLADAKTYTDSVGDTALVQSNKYIEIYHCDFSLTDVEEYEPIYNNEGTFFYDICFLYRNISNKTIKIVLFDLSYYDINGNILFDCYNSNTFGLVRPNETSDEEIYLGTSVDDLKKQIYSVKVTKVSIIFEDYTFVSVNEDITFKVGNYRY